MATLAIYISALCDHSSELASGESGVVLLIAPNQKQSLVALDYCEGIIRSSPGLAQFVVSRTADTLSLSNGIDIQVRAANFRQLRGITCVAVLADEAAFFADDSGESTNPDTEILNAVRPSLATTNGPLLIASSAYRRTGALWNLHRDYYSVEDPSILCVKGTSREFNPSLPQAVIDRALERDPAAARAEYLAEWRDDLESYVSKDIVLSCVEEGVRERPPNRQYTYFGFVDAAGGSGADSMTLCIGHDEDGTAVIDAIREFAPPFSPDATVADFAMLLRTYGIREVTGDKWGGDFVGEAFRRHNIEYHTADKNKSEMYVEVLPRLNSRTISLPDLPKLINQLASLERRHSRTGRVVISAPPRAHDDVSDSVCGCAVLVGKPKHTAFWATVDLAGKVSIHNDAEKQRSWKRST
ncbi:hypothetical protein FNL55_20900 [Tardiphaga sp. vice352]|uniref:hypothetical protein n=1 Tax=Tardiphaga sp. vice352 TaxID=2592816 RepID=UPI001164ECB9|nr:hypothetical protein [Tardiphaga sp. vice352]QDM33521.1 hypothetical protein FNL55_20900 [Tardiphaga sp. vice352]